MIFAFFCLVVLSCDVLRDMPFEVCGWSPGSGVIADVQNLAVSLQFSHEPDRQSIEKSFALTEDGAALKGNFIWYDKKVIFVPLSPFLEYKDYMVTLATEARTNDGLSLENKFEGNFSTRPEGNRPLIVSIDPPDESTITDVYKKVRIDFSEKITKNSCVSDISFSPAITGSWQIENDGKTAVFLLKEPLKNPEIYKVTIAASFQSAASKMLGKQIVSRWTVGTDTIAPVLENICAVDADGREKFDLALYDPQTMSEADYISENQLFEANDNLKLTFSEPIDVLKLKNSLMIEPALKYTVAALPQFTKTITVLFADKPIWGNRYVIKVNSGICDASGNTSTESYIFRVYANGIYSKPPTLAALRLPQDFVNGAVLFEPDDMFHTIDIVKTLYPAEIEKDFFVELYFETAEDAQINLFSLRELFRIETTNNAISFSSRLVIDSGFSQTDPAEGFSSLQRIEVKGKITNSNNLGLIKFYIAPGLTDTKLNKNTKAMSIQLNK
ncbi:MAG: hypothetical protein Ta2F_03750 [Termitinemataceae bacterium]|nr:MAG: hypothetical protein Ta2F_03750 [Termitinemataceae bacterium]